MKRILVAIVAIVVASTLMSAQNIQDNADTARKESRAEIMTFLASLPDASVTYLTKSMLQRLPENKAESPLGILVGNGSIESIRVFELGSAEAETAGKKLLDSYISETKGREPELLALQNNISGELQIYGLPFDNDIYKYNRILIFSKIKGEKTVLIIITGSIPENIIGKLIDSFQK